MEENKFYDLYGFHLNPLEMNNWMLCQQPYFNYPMDGFPGSIGISYGSLPLQNEYDHVYLQGNYQNISKSKFFPGNQNDDHQSISSNNKNEYYKKTDKNSRFQGLSHNSQKNQNKVQKTENNQTLKTDSSKGTFEILNRNKKGDEEKFRKAFSSTVKIDLDKDFPPITASVMNEPSSVQERTLDFRLALQKPKLVVLPDNKVDKENIKDENQEKVKKKRKRNRKKKIVEKPAEPFSFVDDEFPSLENVKIEEKLKVEKQETKQVQDTVKINKVASNDERKKLKKRQLLFILPGDMEGQVRVIQAPNVPKNKTKRKVNQDRMKKPIGVLNPLDLSAPLVKRGKERLKPKPKKPSKLKKAILHYRNLKKELREKSNFPLPDNTESSREIDNLTSSEAEIKIPEKKPEILASRMHSKNFREYCNHMIDNKINSIISQLLKTLIGFQDKLYNRDPFKAKLKRRLCFGLREVTKFVNMKKLRLIIIAPDLEKIEIEGGLDDIVSLIIKGARESGIPYVFGLSRSSLAYLCYKKYRVGAIGVFNYDGAETYVKELLVCVDKAREQYNQIKQIMESINQDVSPFSPSLTVDCTYSSDDKCNPSRSNDSIPYHAGHSRTPSNALSEPISDIMEMNKLLFNSIMEDQFNSTNSDREDNDHVVNEAKDEDRLIDDYVKNILNSVAKLSFHDENV